ncbi:MAG TPA: hypothetical protein VNO32_59870, partial [Candidatus Acidoferrum sp.]|nr:hypothetical protein [Candidatus Acidoferrum sp.]
NFAYSASEFHTRRIHKTPPRYTFDSVDRKLDRFNCDTQFLMCRNMGSDGTRKGSLDVGDAYSYYVRASGSTAKPAYSLETDVSS